MGETLVSVCLPRLQKSKYADHLVGMGEGQVTVPAAIRHKLHDPNVKFEEYLYYAKIQREQEKRGLGPKEREEMFNGGAEPEQISDASGIDEKSGEKTPPITAVIPGPTSEVTPAEWETASRAARNAGWASM